MGLKSYLRKVLQPLHTSDLPDKCDLFSSDVLFMFFQDDVELCVTQLEKVVPNYLLRFDFDNNKSGSPISACAEASNSHSDYGSSISSHSSITSSTAENSNSRVSVTAASTTTAIVENNLPNEMNDSCILVS